MARRCVIGANTAREIKKLLRGSGEVSRRQGAAPGLAFDSDYVAPFTVQWAQSANDGDGAWIIWLPGSRLVMIGNSPLDPSDDLDDVGGDYPEGWYILDDEMLDPDEGGTLYLNIAFTDLTNSATFSDHAVSPSGSSETSDQYINVRVCEATVEESGERKVEQFVTSAIVFWNGGIDHDTIYDCDNRSITRADYAGSDSSTLPGNYFYLNGFGKFTIGDTIQEHGFYDAPTVAEVEVDGEPTTFAAICRTGNSSSPNTNFIAYKKLKIKSVGGSSPFAYEKSTTTSGGSTVTLHKLVNCCFYWNGELQTLADYDVSGLLGGGTVYLRGTQAAPSSSTPDPTWTWTLGTAEQQAPNGGKALNYKLYDFAQSKVAVDYRTTFLALEDHTQKAIFTVAKPNGDGSITLDASGSSPKLVITDGTNTVNIDLADIPNDCSGNFGFHSFSYKDKNGDTQIFHGLFCDDIDLSDIQGGKTIKDVNVTPSSTETTVKFTYSDGTFTEIHIPHGLKGDPGGKGDDGDTPEITADTANGVTHIYADGDLIATLFDGHTPVITASKSNGVTTIYADGVAIAQINDGAGGSAEMPDKDVVTDVTFSISNGKLVATLSKENLKTGATSTATKDVCDVGELDVVTGESYSTSTHQFTNVRKRVKVIGTPANATGQTPFTATPLSGE